MFTHFHLSLAINGGWRRECKSLVLNHQNWIHTLFAPTHHTHQPGSADHRVSLMIVGGGGRPSKQWQNCLPSEDAEAPPLRRSSTQNKTHLPSTHNGAFLGRRFLGGPKAPLHKIPNSDAPPLRRR